MSAEILLLLAAAAAPVTLEIPADAVDVSFGPDGTIYCLRLGEPELVVISAGGVESASWNLDPVLLPVSLVVRTDGSFLVCDASTGIVHRFTDRAEQAGWLEAPPGTACIASDGAEVWCFSPDDEAVYSIQPSIQRISAAEGFRPADMSMVGRRAVLSSPAGSFLVEPGSSTRLSSRPACLAGASVLVLDGDSLRVAGTDSARWSGTGDFDRLVGDSEGRILLWRSGSGEAVLLE